MPHHPIRCGLVTNGSGRPWMSGIIDPEPCSASHNLLPTALPPLSARANGCGRVPALSGGGSSPNAATPVGGANVTVTKIVGVTAMRAQAISLGAI